MLGSLLAAVLGTSFLDVIGCAALARLASAMQTLCGQELSTGTDTCVCCRIPACVFYSRCNQFMHRIQHLCGQISSCT